MKLTKGRVQCCIEAVTTTVVDMYAKKKNVPRTNALRSFMLSKTFNSLNNPKLYLFLESPAYTFEMLDAEEKGDWERWGRF
jgi:hypothetical protein